MKFTVMMRRQLRQVLLPLVCFWPGMLVFAFLPRWLFALFGMTVNGIIPLLAPWMIVCVIFAMTHWRDEFALGMQTGVSRKHIFWATMIVWGLALAVIAAGLGLLALAVPQTPLLRDLGYVGVWYTAARVADMVMVVLMLVAAILGGLTCAFADMALTRGWITVIAIALGGLLLWVANASLSASVTQNIANGALTVRHTGAAATPYLWPLVLGGFNVLLFGADWLLVRHCEPR